MDAGVQGKVKLVGHNLNLMSDAIGSKNLRLDFSFGCLVNECI